MLGFVTLHCQIFVSTILTLETIAISFNEIILEKQLIVLGLKVNCDDNVLSLLPFEIIRVRIQLKVNNLN